MTKSNIENYFDRVSERYSDHFTKSRTGKFLEFESRKRIVGILSRNFSGSLLDCSCGSGEVSYEAIKSNQFSDLTLVDLSSNMLEIAKKRLSGYPRIQFINSDIFTFNGDYQKSYDLILCIGLIAHTGHLEELLLHLKKMLNENGAILLQSTSSEKLFPSIVRFSSDSWYFTKNEYKIKYFKRADIKIVANNSGLKIVNEHSFSFGLPFADRFFPLINFYIELLYRKFFINSGVESIFMLQHQNSPLPKYD
jgi:ubiquinone/menaquinone biosynthesis C-methylase UbiE